MKPIRLFRGIVAGAFLAAASAARADALDGIAVVVNDSIITILQVQDAVATPIQTLVQLYPDPETFKSKARELQDNAVESLIQGKLILDDFDKAGYATNVLESAVEDQINRIIKDRYGGDRARLIKTLYAEGRTFEAFRKEEREAFIINYMSHYNPGIKKMIISPLKIQTYYNDHKDEFKVDDQVKLRMIAIPQPPGSPPGTAREVAEEILRKIDGGVPFAEMAAVYSSSPSRAAGGDRGWVERKDFVAALTDVAFSLKAGQHSQVVELPDERTGSSTCYLLMVEEVRPAHVSALSEVQAGIEQTLKDKETKRLVQQWINRLKAKSHIESF